MDMDLDAYRQQSRETWDRMAGGWEARREGLMAITAPGNDWLAESADPQPGQTGLEIAAGAGDLGLRLAERGGGTGPGISPRFAPGAGGVAGAGLGEPKIEELTFAFGSREDDDFWDAIVGLAGPLARAVMALPDGEQRAAREAIMQNMASFRNDDGSYTAPASTWVVLAR